MPATANRRAEISVTLDGKDLAAKIDNRLLSATITEKRDEAADELQLVLSDHDGKLAIPPEGAVLAVSIGWVAGTDVPFGLVDKGLFKVDQVEHSGTPDQISITARSADFTAALRVRKDRSHTETTLGELATKVAGEHDLEAQVAPELAQIEVPVLAQSARSDIALLRQLGARHDAVATVKKGKLILSPIGRGTTASGKSIPAITLVRRDGDRHRYTRAAREAYDGVTASWHDQDAAERKTVRAGAEKPGKTRRLKKTYATEADAKHAATAELGRSKRAEATFDLDLAVARATLAPEQRVTLIGWKPEIDGKSWLIAEVTHGLDAQGGLSTKIKLEVA